MNCDLIQSSWKQVAGKTKWNWGKLTDGDIDVVAGRRGQLVGKLQELARNEANGSVPRWHPLQDTHAKCAALPLARLQRNSS